MSNVAQEMSKFEVPGGRAFTPCGTSSFGVSCSTFDIQNERGKLALFVKHCFEMRKHVLCGPPQANLSCRSLRIFTRIRLGSG